MTENQNPKNLSTDGQSQELQRRFDNLPQQNQTNTAQGVTRTFRNETQEEIELKNKLNTTGIFSPEKKALQNLETIRLYKEGEKTRIIIDSQNENVGINVTETHKQLAGTSKKSEFDVEIGDYKIAYKIDGKNVTADMSSMNQEAAAGDEALRVTLTDADQAKYGNVSIQIDPQTMKPVLVSDKEPPMTEAEMEAMKQDLIKTYGNRDPKGKNAAMTINGVDGSVEFKDLGFMSQVEIEQKKQQVKDNLEATRNTINEVDVDLPGFGTAVVNRSTDVVGRPLGTSVRTTPDTSSATTTGTGAPGGPPSRTTVDGVNRFGATSTQVQNEQKLLLEALKKSNDRRDSLENEINKLRAQVSSLENDKEGLNKEAENLRLRITTLEATLNERTQNKDEQIAKLEVKVQELEKGINDKETIINDFNSQIGGLKNEIENLNKEIQRLNQEKETDIIKKDEIDRNIAQLQEQVVEKNNDLGNLRTELDKTIRERDGFKDELEKANKELDRLKNEKAQSETQAQEQSQKYEAQKAQILKIAEKLGITIDPNNPNPDLSELLKKINELKSQLEEKAREIKLKDEQIEMSKSQITALTEENDKLKKSNETLLTQNKDLTSKNDLQTKEINELKDDLDQAKQEIESLKTQQGQSETNSKDQQEKINEIAKGLGIIIDPSKPISLDDLSGKITEMQKKINDLENEKNTLQDANKRLSDTVATQKTSIDELTNKNFEQTSELKKLRDELAKATDQIQDQNKKIAEKLGIDPNDPEIASKILKAINNIRNDRLVPLSPNSSIYFDSKTNTVIVDNQLNDRNVNEQMAEKYVQEDFEKFKKEGKIPEDLKLEDLKYRIVIDNKELEKYKEENKQLETNNQNLKSNLEVAKENLRKSEEVLNKQIERLKKENGELETENETHKKTIENQKNQISGLKKGNRTLESKLEAQKAKYEEALNKEKARGDKLNENNTVLQEQLNQEKGKNDQLNQKNNSLKGELDKANQANKALAQENQQQKTQLDLYKDMANRFENLKNENTQLKNNAKADNKINDQFNKMCPNQESYQKYMNNLNGAIKKLSNDPNEKQTVETLKIIQNEYRKIAKDRGYERYENNNLSNFAKQIDNAPKTSVSAHKPFGRNTQSVHSSGPG